MYFREVSVTEASNLEINYSVDFKKKANRLNNYSVKASKRLSSNLDVNDDQRDYQQTGKKLVEKDLPSPPKSTKLVIELPYQGELAIGISDVKSTSIVTLDNMPHTRESEDLFGDSISPGGLSELSCMNNLSSCLRKTRSYPVTPNFDVCSEKLEIRDISECSPSSIFLSPSLNLNETEQCQATFDIQGDPLDDKKTSERLVHTLSNRIKAPKCSNNADENCIVQLEATMSNKQLAETCRSENTVMSPENPQVASNLFKTPQNLIKPFSNDLNEKTLSRNTILPYVSTQLNNLCLLSPNSVNNSQTALNKHSTPEINPSPGSFVFSDSDTDGNVVKSPNDSIEMKSKHMPRYLGCPRNFSLIS